MKRFNLKNTLAITGLIFSIIGTIIIWIDSQYSIKTMSVLLEDVASRVGYWQDNTMETYKMETFKLNLEKASKLDIRGFILLMIGFVLQGLSIIDLKKINL